MFFPGRHWQQITWLSVLLLPLACLFRMASALRRIAYRTGLLSSIRLPVPVVVVGNITAGGTGKTPLVIHLCELLLANGYRPGVISRGYGSALKHAREVPAGGDPRMYGDEPLLLVERTACPVFVGHDRVDAARALLSSHPECNVMISDDGLQHYRLARTLELAVIDAQRGLGNGLPLPSGPLREPRSRLRTVNAIVNHGGRADAPTEKPPRFCMQLDGNAFVSVLTPSCTVDAAHFAGRKIHAIAGIGAPQRFFGHLQRLGLAVTGHPFPDHHVYAPADLAFADAEAVLMTEKDAVKCRPFANESHWALRVYAIVSPALDRLVLDSLRNDQSQAA